MSATFTPSNAIDMSNERTWPADLGMLDWDSTNIVFTKRSLIEFLKYTGITVDPNFGTIAKLPRYAKFGKISESAGSSAEQATDNVDPSSSHANIFGSDDNGDALSGAPPRQNNVELPQSASSTTTNDSNDATPPESLPQPQVRTSRRVRTTPGGVSTIGNIFAPEEDHDSFKPTRKVREGPGGQDHIGSLF
ncbi:hypothetical protein AGABI2DRAFT_183454 [Agaricus bisporus var. bisporus H97]|uniref:hypothetical protein n=1 Tax=Agaricus bisporus var. bisporus (strain H97 / ATCC MYA-4626 / FGSC 10389) TaxID=936046 RepID=UPI00029F78B5|nr:hypothetical protein AGABI2DRAFT_183454 [Agaricus bisporus var. bisporus H97]EKV50373.1 hypothetical protein AGABI2DRAFT_183454 [Agaricus bisporus var. bisporus H97]